MEIEWEVWNEFSWFRHAPIAVSSELSHAERVLASQDELCPVEPIIVKLT
jgi:hypothetical protein